MRIIGKFKPQRMQEGRFDPCTTVDRLVLTGWEIVEDEAEEALSQPIAKLVSQRITPFPRMVFYESTPGSISCHPSDSPQQRPRSSDQDRSSTP